MRPLALLSCCLLASCVRFGATHSLTCDCPPSGPQLETLTMNAGLAPGIEAYATPRIKPFAWELNKYRGAGIICLQEVWTDEARDAVIAALQLPPENVYYVDTAGRNEEPGKFFCTADEFQGLEQCVESRCLGVPAEDTARCAFSECRWELAKLYWNSKRCINCLLATVGGSLDDVKRSCLNDRGVSRVYGGRNGVILASRWPLRNREYVELPSSAANRVALFARIDLAGYEPLEVACTHISMSADQPPTDPMFRNWTAEKEAQIQIISDKLAERAGTRPALFLGDLNTGPGWNSVVKPTFPDVWSLIVRLGFVSPVTRVWPPICSMCNDNTFRRSSPDHLIDHVLVRDPPGGTDLTPLCAHPIMTEAEWIWGHDKRLVYTNLSDHYGIVVKFSLRNR